MCHCRPFSGRFSAKSREDRIANLNFRNVRCAASFEDFFHLLETKKYLWNRLSGNSGFSNSFSQRCERSVEQTIAKKLPQSRCPTSQGSRRDSAGSDESPFRKQYVIVITVGTMATTFHARSLRVGRRPEKKRSPGK